MDCLVALPVQNCTLFANASWLKTRWASQWYVLCTEMTNASMDTFWKRVANLLSGIIHGPLADAKSHNIGPLIKVSPVEPEIWPRYLDTMLMCPWTGCTLRADKAVRVLLQLFVLILWINKRLSWLMSLGDSSSLEQLVWVTLSNGRLPIFAVLTPYCKAGKALFWLSVLAFINYHWLELSHSSLEKTQQMFEQILHQICPYSGMYQLHLEEEGLEFIYNYHYLLLTWFLFRARGDVYPLRP